MPTHPPDDIETDREHTLWRDLSRLFEDYCGPKEEVWPERELEFKRIVDRVFAPLEEKERSGDLTVQLRGVDFNTIEFIQGTEKALDAALLPMGFTRQTSTKTGERAMFQYRQFAACGVEAAL